MPPAPGPAATPTPAVQPVQQPTRVGYGPELFPAGVNPLTGLPVTDPALLDRRPIAVKITNFPRPVRPQWGLSLADIVYEYYLEHGLTRFVALYYGNDAARVGPVRSARFFDEHIFRMYKAIFTFANADRKVLDHFLESEFVAYFVVERPGNCPPMCRDRTNRVYNAYNNLFTDTRLLNDYVSADGRIDVSRPDLRGMRFEADMPEGGLPGGSLETVYSPYSYNRWVYDAGAGNYQRWQETVDSSGDGHEYDLLRDQLTGRPITAENVVLLLVPHQYYSEEPEIVTMQLWGSGPGYVFRDGLVFQATWNRPSQDAILTLAGRDGDPFPLKPGVTFYQVVGHASRVWQFGEDWRVDFTIAE